MSPLILLFNTIVEAPSRNRTQKKGNTSIINVVSKKIFCSEMTSNAMEKV